MPVSEVALKRALKELAFLKEMTGADVMRAGGPSKPVVQSVLGRRPTKHETRVILTLDKWALALGVSEAEILTRAMKLESLPPDYSPFGSASSSESQGAGVPNPAPSPENN